MGSYRISRNLEASFIEYIEEKLNATGIGWSNIKIEKSFARVYDLDLPAICIRCGVTDHDKVGIGEDSTVRTTDVMIDIFATSDGQKLDIKDFLIEKLKGGLPYYEYTIANGEIQDKTQNGRIRILDIGDTSIDLDTPKDDLDVHDRFRHLLTLSVSLGKVEE